MLKRYIVGFKNHGLRVYTDTYTRKHRSSKVNTSYFSSIHLLACLGLVSSNKSIV